MTVAAVAAARAASASLGGGTGAVVVGGDYQGLGIVRSLGRRGIPVLVVDDEPSVARFSRYTQQTFDSGSLRGDDRIVEILEEAGERFDMCDWVLYATRDEVVAAIARARTRLLRTFRVPTPPWETVRYADDKRLTYELAQELQIPTPRTWCPGALGELDLIPADGWPLLVKPAIKEHFIYATGVKGWPVNSHRELHERYREAIAIVPSGEVMVQEMIPGEGDAQFSYCAFFKEGSAIGRMIVRRRRQRPRQLGRSSTFVETTREPLLVEYSERFLRAIEYYGLVEMEFKYDARDGQFKLLDVNPRTWGYHGIGARAGVDFPYLVFADQLGEEVTRVEARAGITWVRLTTDLAVVAPQLARGSMSWREYARSLRDVDAEAVFSRDDPKPGFAELLLLPYLIHTRRQRGRRR